MAEMINFSINQESAAMSRKMLVGLPPAYPTSIRSKVAKTNKLNLESLSVGHSDNNTECHTECPSRSRTL